MKESTKLLKDIQEKETYDRIRERQTQEEERKTSQEVEERKQEIFYENQRMKSELNKVDQLRAAYNADRNAFIHKIEELEREIRNLQTDKSEVEHKLKLQE